MSPVANASDTGPTLAAIQRQAEALVAAAFAKPRTPRSPMYRAGALAAVVYRLGGARIQMPYKPGTAEADAFFSGIDEGHALWRKTAEAVRPMRRLDDSGAR